MKSTLTVTELFKAAGLQPSGPVPWLKPVPEKSPGVYVVAIVPTADGDCDPIDVSDLPIEITARWNESQPVIYVGRASKSISRRISQFYQHRYENRSPHRGGRDVLLLKCALWVYWSPTDNYDKAENVMIEAFKAAVGRLPFANRMRSARVGMGTTKSMVKSA